MSDWGKYGSADEHQRYSVKRESRRRGRRRCNNSPGCHNPCTHAGYANGVCLMIGCELCVARWVQDPLWSEKRKLAEQLKEMAANDG